MHHPRADFARCPASGPASFLPARALTTLMES